MQWGAKVDFVYLVATTPERHSGDQVHNVKKAAAPSFPFFTASGGLTTKNTDFEFNAVIDDKFVFTGTKSFTLANGNALADADPTLFQF